MPPALITALWAVLATAGLAAVAEWLQARRVRRLQRLAFGPEGRPRVWTRAVPALRVLALSAFVGGLVLLLAFDGVSRAQETTGAATRHLLVLLDVSPSMHLEDAGASPRRSRSARAAEVLKSILDRAPGAQVKVTMTCFYTDAILLVRDCADREVIWNFVDNLPLHIAFTPGRTDLVKALNHAGQLLKDSPRRSTTVVVLSDGDAVPDTGLKPLPSAVNDLILIGLGDPSRGTFVDGHLSRQDSASLAQLARRLGGRYHNGNLKHVPSDWLRRLTAPDERPDRWRFNLRSLALAAVSSGAGLLVLLPVLLAVAGSAWRPLAVLRTPSGERGTTGKPAPAPRPHATAGATL